MERLNVIIVDKNNFVEQLTQKINELDSELINKENIIENLENNSSKLRK